MNYNSEDLEAERNDPVKLALLHVLSHGLFGNQVARELPALYVNLVDNLDGFNNYPWGDDVWTELVDIMRTNSKSLKKCAGQRVTLPGCLIAIQVWAFETFTGLEKAEICKLIEGRESRIPRAVKREFIKKPSMELLSKIIFKNEQFEWKMMEPTNLEGEHFPNLLANERLSSERSSNDGIDIVNRVDGVKVFEKKGKNVKTKVSSKVVKKSKTKAKEEDMESEKEGDDGGRVGFGSARKLDLTLRKVRKLSKENAKIMAELRELKKSQKRQEKMVKQLLEVWKG
ncbi:unnamed protein product [Cuscuta europaea]|uniref:DUF1985 domain-containing protein n=1 Tax=Cuscuta europaea TaxID=41803 RepID=A0A9P1E2L9_CUSEU|nr:unnamed protein product [Cuscuta europaea]